MRDHERQVIEALIKSALAAGYALSVNDGEDETVTQSTDESEVMGALCTTDEDYLIIYRDGARIGHVYLVYGNEPGVVMSDNTDSAEMDSIMATANDIGERLSEAG
jgi:hypothetical protein